MTLSNDEIDALTFHMGRQIRKAIVGVFHETVDDRHQARIAALAATVASGIAAQVGSATDDQRTQVAERSLDIARKIARGAGL